MRSDKEFRKDYLRTNEVESPSRARNAPILRTKSPKKQTGFNMTVSPKLLKNSKLPPLIHSITPIPFRGMITAQVQTTHEEFQDLSVNGWKDEDIERDSTPIYRTMDARY
jgi:hypothetical protein